MLTEIEKAQRKIAELQGKIDEQHTEIGILRTLVFFLGALIILEVMLSGSFLSNV